MSTPLEGPEKRRVSDRPESELLALDTAMGAVTLRVADLDTMTSYYRDAVLLSVLADEPAAHGRPSRVVLGRLGKPLVILEHAPELKHAGPSDAGLFHTALVFPTQSDLAASVLSVARARPDSFTGSADHAVSEAFYFDDPEGNGLELYVDRPRSSWHWTGGSIEIRADRLNPNEFIQQHINGTTLGRVERHDAEVGHVHLSVGDVPTARDFYVDKLGFEITASIPAAVFVSAGGYHHHMAMNVFGSRGAPKRQLTLGLGLVRIDLPTRQDLDALQERLAHKGVPTRFDGETLELEDPWDNTLQVRAADN